MFDLFIITLNITSITIAFLRGFIKEVFGLIGISISLFVTINHYDFFITYYSPHINSSSLLMLLSVITVFVLVIITVIVLNSWLMHLLSSLRQGIVDRFAGLLIGIVKGIMFSYLIFFVIKLTCYSLYVINDEDKKKSDEELMPVWFISSYSYKILDLIDSNINEMIPDSAHDKVKNIGYNINKTLNKKDSKKKLSRKKKQL